MHPQQRHARFDLIVISIALVLGIITYSFMYVGGGHAAARSAFACFAIVGILGFDGRFYRKKKGVAVVLDERDLAIQRKARSIGWNVVWLYWCIVCMGPWFYHTMVREVENVHSITFPIGNLPLAYMMAYIVFLYTSAIAVLVMYGRGIVDHEA